MEKINNLLEIILITYNRKKHLSDTLQQILAQTSPIKDLDITILDNASTDGSSELLKEYALKYPNLKHIRHPKNIGGNANIARAFETAKKKYVWVLCDDDKYDFSSFNKLEEALSQNPTLIVVANYINPDKNKARLFKQLSFLPAGIYRTDLITSTVLFNVYFNISNMFPQLAVAAEAINYSEEIIILEKPLVTMIPNCGNDAYTRGEDKGFIHPFMKDMFWEMGYLNSIEMIKDAKVRSAAMSDCDPQNRCFYSVTSNILCETQNKGLRCFANFITSLDLKHKIMFLFFLLPAFLCTFQIREKGLYVRLFCIVKTKLIPFKTSGTSTKNKAL